MKSVINFVPAIAALLVFTTARADDLAVSASPYASLVERNVFGLVPIPPPPVVDPNPPPPPVKITLTGIMNIFGKDQALFKTPGAAKPGVPAKEESFVMGVGERQDDIEVRKIDSVAGVVTFDNHGVIQELPLEMAKNAPAPPSPGGGPVPQVPGLSPTAAAAGGAPGRFGRAHTQTGRPNVSTGGAETQPSASLAAPGSLGGGTATANASVPGTPEEQILMQEVQMEMQREKWKNEGNPGAAIIPDTQVAKELNEAENSFPTLPAPSQTPVNNPPHRRR